LRVRADGFKELVQTIAPTQKGEIKAVLTKTTDEAELAFQAAERNAHVRPPSRRGALPQSDQAPSEIPGSVSRSSARFVGYAKSRRCNDGDQQARKQRLGYAEASAVEGRIYKGNGRRRKGNRFVQTAITEGKGFQPEALTGLGLFYKEKAEEFGGAGDFEQEEANYIEATKYCRREFASFPAHPTRKFCFNVLGLVLRENEKIRRRDWLSMKNFSRYVPKATKRAPWRSVHRADHKNR
jgi:hypothetical protein